MLQDRHMLPDDLGSCSPLEDPSIRGMASLTKTTHPSHTLCVCVCVHTLNTFVFINYIKWNHLEVYFPVTGSIIFSTLPYKETQL